MALRTPLSQLILLILAFIGLISAATQGTNLPNVVTISYEFVHDTSSVKPLATIFYDPKTLKTHLSSWNPPSTSAQSTSLKPTSPKRLRILLPCGSSTLTSLHTFNTTLTQTISLHISPADASIFSAAVTASYPPTGPIKTTKSKQKAERDAAAALKARQKQKQAQNPAASKPDDFANVHVELIPPRPGPTPKLNTRKPPSIGVDGKEVPAEEVQEKSFLQKYWWVFLIVTAFAMLGGGDK